MEDSKKIQSLWIVIILLILINISVLTWLWFSQRTSQDPLSPERVEKALHFTHEQEVQFGKIKDEHFDDIRPIRDSIKILKSELFDYLKKGETNPQFVEAKMKVMLEKIKENETKTLQHFAKIRAMCTPEQKEIFDNDIVEKFKKQGPSGTGHPRQGERPPRP